VTSLSGARSGKRPGRAGTESDEIEFTVDVGEASDWNAGSEISFELARAKANENLAQALVRAGWSSEGARIVARACVKPDDVRRRIAAPVELRVPGGTMLLVETTVFSHGVTIYPSNLRELGTRLYPLGMVDHQTKDVVISDPVADVDYLCELVLDVRDPDQLSERLRSSEAWLNRRNPLVSDIAVEGVLQPVTLVGMRIDHRNGAPSTHLLTAADGSSRTTAAHKILSVDAADLVYGTGSSDRLFRQQIGAVLRLLHEHGWAGLTDEDRRRVRALTMPARIIIGYRQEAGRGVGFDAAVRSLIGLTHIAPPMPYGTEVERDATADAVLDALRRPHRGRPPRISTDEARWYAAVMSPAERDAAGLSPYPDVRAADITRVLMHGGRRTTLRVNAGIRSITARNSPTAEERVAIAVELILRPWRTAHAGDQHLSLAARRSALQRAYGMAEISRQPDEPLLEGLSHSEYTLEDLRDQALDEVAEGLGRRKDQPLGPAQVELATKAAYYLILSEPMGLRREAPPSARLRDDVQYVDQRSPSVVLTAMLATTRGVRQAYAIVACGRAGDPLWEVDEDGQFVGDDARSRMVLTDEYVRATYGGKGPRQRATAGLAAVEHAWQELVQSLTALEKATKAVADVRSAAGRSYLDEEGWPDDEVDAVRRRLDHVDHLLRSWQDRWAARQKDRPDDDSDE
jgi:hypothetical protein